MKTIFITISRGGTARNILQTDVFKTLKESGAKIVILTPAYQDERFINEFGGKNVRFENLISPRWTLLDRFLVGWYKALLYNHSTKFRDLYGIYDPKEGGVLKYLIKSVIFIPLSKLQFLKELFRWLDEKLIEDKYYNGIFDKYKPDLVFSTSTMEDADVFVLKQARARKIKTIGMAKSWDNAAKMVFRVKTDKFIVWGDYSEGEAKKFQNYKKENIIITGVPQFDFYTNGDFYAPRDEFFKSIGCDAGKKLIVFCSEGKVTKYDGEVVEIIAGFINENKLIKPAMLFVRPHFMYLADEEKFKRAAKMSNVVLDASYKRSANFRDNWDYSKEQIKHFSGLMGNADLIITTASTISLDAAACDKPIINISFDGYHKVPFAESAAHWYLSEHNRNVVKTGAAWIVDGKEELLNAINSYLKNSDLLSGGRKKLRNHFCYKIDGLAGKRIGEEIINYANQ